MSGVHQWWGNVNGVIVIYYNFYNTCNCLLKIAVIVIVVDNIHNYIN